MNHIPLNLTAETESDKRFQRTQRRYTIAIGILSVIATFAFIASVVLFCWMRSV